MADRGEVAAAFLGEQPVDLVQERHVGGAAERIGPKRAILPGGAGDQRGGLQKALFGWQIMRDLVQALERGGIVSGEMRHHGTGGRSPGAVEVDQSTVLVEQNGAQSVH